MQHSAGVPVMQLSGFQKVLGEIADVFDVRENPDLKGFDYVIIGSSILGSKIHSML